MVDTPNLKFPYISAAQAQKHLAHNDAIRMLDALVQLAVRDRHLGTPPLSPIEGDRYIVGPSPAGAWTGHENSLAAWQDGAWMFFMPGEGWVAWVADEDQIYVWNGTTWGLAAVGSVNPAPLVGINATADATNRLTVSSAASLFNHAGHGHQVKINKNAAGDTASFLFQTAFSGRAEMGTAGDDDFHFKVSADGSAFVEAMVIDRATGRTRFPAGLEHAATRQATSQFIITPGGDGEVSIVRFDRTRSPGPRTATISNVTGDLITLTTDDADLFFTFVMRNVSYVRIWNTSKAGPPSAWVKWNPAVNQLQVLSAASVSGWAAGETIRLGDNAGWPGVPASFTIGFAVDVSPMLLNRLGGVFRQKGLMFKCTIFGNGVRAGMVASPATASGSFYGGNSLSDGQPNLTTHTVPTTELSPVSNSNLVFIREDGAANGLATCALSVVGVWV